jgi:low affinity Fe/Cu permease
MSSLGNDKRTAFKREAELISMEQERRRGFRDMFSRFAGHVSHFAGSPTIFILALASLVVWGLLGPAAHYSDTWQLIINTATTIVTFLMVFLIQNTQNRDAKAIHLKLNEIIHAIGQAHNEMIDVERLSDEELENLTKHYERIRQECDRRQQAKQQSQSPGAA